MSSKELLGYNGEQFVRGLFKNAGYTVRDCSEIYGFSTPFDFIAEKADESYAVKVRTTRTLNGKLSMKLIRNKAHVACALGFALPKSTVRLLWHYSMQYQEHTTYGYAPGGFNKVDNPLASLLPPPLTRKPLGRPRKYNKETGERVY